jgi:hypothetical protein
MTQNEEPLMTQPDAPLSPGVQQFVESIGLYFEQYGLARIGGRILALLMIADRPLSLDDMARLLLVSRASISTNIRLAATVGLAEQVSLPGDRRDYYHYGSDAWNRAFKADLEGLVALRRLTESGLAALGPNDSVGRAHLQETIEFCEFCIEEYTAVQARWQARQAARAQGEHTDDATSTTS